MKKFICILILLIILCGGITGAYLSYVLVEPWDIVFIKTKFRSYKQYNEGKYFFPERLMFWEPKAFVIFKVYTNSITTTNNITINLPPISLINSIQKKLGLKKDSLKIKYFISLTYKLSIDYQGRRILKDYSSIAEFRSYFKEWLSKKSKNLANQYLLLHLDKNNTIEIKDILKELDNLLIKEIENKYSSKDIIISKDKAIHYLSQSTDLNHYFSLYRQAKTFEKDFLVQQLDHIKSKEKEIALVDIEKQTEKQKSKIEVEQLKLYGELFKKYPQLLNYLYLKKLSDNVKIIVVPKDSKNIFSPFVLSNSAKKTFNKKNSSIKTNSTIKEKINKP